MRSRGDGPLCNSGTGTQNTRLPFRPLLSFCADGRLPSRRSPSLLRRPGLAVPHGESRIIIWATRSGLTFIQAAGVPRRPAWAWKDQRPFGELAR